MASNSSPDLKLDWCTYRAAKYAVERWHYSKVMPKAKSIFVGVWEDGKFIGTVIFGLGGGAATDGRKFGLKKSFEVAEIERVALTTHRTPVSRIIKIAITFLRRQSPGIRLCVSYADPNQGHHGGIYQAGGWIYVGTTMPDKALVDKTGKQRHSRTVSNSGIKKHFGVVVRTLNWNDGKRISLLGKHKYLYPLDRELRKRLESLRKPYPKRAGSDTVDTSGAHPEKGGLEPTPALQTR